MLPVPRELLHLQAERSTPQDAIDVLLVGNVDFDRSEEGDPSPAPSDVESPRLLLADNRSAE